MGVCVISSFGLLWIKLLWTFMPKPFVWTCAFISLQVEWVNHKAGVWLTFFFNKFIYFIYLFLAALGLHCCVRAFSSCSEWGPLSVEVHGPLIAVASLVAEHRLQVRRLQQLWCRALVGHVESSLTRARTRVPWIGRRIPNHCAIREALINF